MNGIKKLIYGFIGAIYASLLWAALTFQSVTLVEGGTPLGFILWLLFIGASALIIGLIIDWLRRYWNRDI
jgi:hypothetical protein